MNRKILYVDMDDTLADYSKAVAKWRHDNAKIDFGGYENIPGFFATLDPIPGAIDAFNILANHFDTYILSTPPWHNESGWSNKLTWVKSYLGYKAQELLILTHHKHLNKGDFIIDDRTVHGVDKFQGEHIHFGSERFPNWDTVLDYLLRGI